MWSSTLNDFTTAALVLQRIEQPAVAITLLSVRDHSGVAAGFGTGRLDMAERLRRDHPDLFEECWERGRHLTPRAANNYALRTIDEAMLAGG